MEWIPLILNQSAPTPGKATRLREVKSEDVGSLGWAGIGADGEDKVGDRQHWKETARSLE